MTNFSPNQHQQVRSRVTHTPGEICELWMRICLDLGRFNFHFPPKRTDDTDYVDSTLLLPSPNVSETALVSRKRRTCVVSQTIPSTALCPPPLIQMILPFIFLLASLLQQYGSEAESSHVSKFQPPSVKEQNGELSLFLLLLLLFLYTYDISHTRCKVLEHYL